MSEEKGSAKARCPLSGEECGCTDRSAIRRGCVRDVERQREREADRERRGSPQRFTLTGHRFFGDPNDRSMTLPEIDPPLEQDEVVEVVSVADLLSDESIERVLAAVPTTATGQWIGRNTVRSVLVAVLAREEDDVSR